MPVATRVPRQPETQAMPGKDRNRWIIGGIDHLHPETEGSGEKADICCKVIRPQADFGHRLGHCGVSGHFVISIFEKTVTLRPVICKLTLEDLQKIGIFPRIGI